MSRPRRGRGRLGRAGGGGTASLTVALVLAATLTLTMALALTLTTSLAVRDPAMAAPQTSTSTGPSASTTGRAVASGLVLTLQSLSPTVVSPTATLVIRGTVTNAGTTAVQNGTVRLLVHHSPLISRALVAQWASGAIADLGGQIAGAGADLPATLAPGASQQFRIKVAGSALGLLANYESIGITLEAIGDDGSALGTRRLGLLRTFITWQQQAAYDQLALSWLFPLTGGPASGTGGPPDAPTLAKALAPGSRLQDVLTAIGSAPGGSSVSVAVDPSLVADLQARTADGDRAATSAGTGSSAPTTGSSAASGGSTESTGATGGSTGGADSSTISGYLTSLKQTLAGRHVVQLPYGDPDLMGTAEGGGASLLTAAQTAAGRGPSSILAQAFNTKVSTTVAWPADGWADDATVTAAHRIGASTLVLSAASRPPDVPQFTTPSGFTPLTSSTGAVLYDDELSSLLARTTSTEPTVLVVQRFLAETLAIVGEHPYRSRILLVAAPRSFHPAPAAAAALFSAVAGAPWLSGAGLHQLSSGQGQDEVSDRSAAPVPGAVRRQEVSSTQVADVKRVRSSAAALATVLTGEAELTQNRTNALRLVGTRYRGHATTASNRVKALESGLTTLGSQVRILPLSTLNFFASNGSLTLSVANDLGRAVQGIRIVVEPGNPRLVVVHQAPAITVDANRRTTIRVRVHAVAAGIVPVTARLVTPSGLTLGTPVQVEVRVRPTDTWAFWVLGVAAGLVFLVGVTRTLRRGRSRPRLVAPEVEELDVE